MHCYKLQYYLQGSENSLFLVESFSFFYKKKTRSREQKAIEQCVFTDKRVYDIMRVCYAMHFWQGALTGFSHFTVNGFKDCFVSSFKYVSRFSYYNASAKSLLRFTYGREICIRKMNEKAL